jgi:glutamine synthetase type III
MTGATGEKHDSFLNFSRKDDKFIIEFSGRELIKGEPDASSFPSGRSTAHISNIFE